MRIGIMLIIRDEDQTLCERVWVELSAHLFNLRLAFRISRSLTEGHLGYSGKPYIRFFIGSRTKHLRLYTTGQGKRDPNTNQYYVKTCYRWAWRLR